MSNVIYNATCRNCSKINGAIGMIMVNGSVENYLKMTEYEFQPILEKWLRDMESTCHFCNSSNIYGENVKIDNIPLYDFQKIVDKLNNNPLSNNFLIFSLQKSGGKITQEIGGKGINDISFFQSSWPKIIDLINEMPSNNFKDNTEGHFVIALTGNSGEIEIQSLKNCGFESYELISQVDQYFMNKLIF